jgi:hypothetical protein
MSYSLERLSVSYQSSATELDLQGNVGCIQIDNHMPRAPFPVMLQVSSYYVNPYCMYTSCTIAIDSSVPKHYTLLQNQ